nr:MAG TPA: hypothetical protein [Bacteriophage sp.]
MKGTHHYDRSHHRSPDYRRHLADRHPRVHPQQRHERYTSL